MPRSATIGLRALLLASFGIVAVAIPLEASLFSSFYWRDIYSCVVGAIHVPFGQIHHGPSSEFRKRPEERTESFRGLRAIRKSVP